MTNSIVTKFAAQSFIQRALRSPNNPRSILSFYYNVDLYSDTHKNELRGGTCFATMSALWYGGGGAEYDRLCQPFGPVIRQRAENQDNNGAWEARSVHNLVAEIVLFDQLSRNIFRGTKAAYEYDEAALERSRTIGQLVLHETEASVDESKVAGQNNDSTEVYPPFLFSTIQSLMHSECLRDHELAVQLLHHAIATAYYNGNATDDSDVLIKWWNQMLQHENDHKQVIDQFGRYPHRNSQMNRRNTPQEDAWLASDNVPGWAK